MLSFSIIIPIYNVSKYILQTLRSIESQTFKNFSLIVVDDGSTDNTLDFVKRFLNKSEINFTILENKVNRGLRYSRIKGLASADTDYVIQFDGDDILFPYALERINEILSDKQFDFIAYERIDFIHNYDKCPKKTDLRPLSIYNSIYSLPLREVNPISIWRYVVKRELANKVYAKQAININFGEDMIFIAHLFLEAHKLVFYDEPLMFYRKRSKSMTDYSNFPKNYLMDLVLSHKYVLDLWGGLSKYPSNYFSFQLLPFRDKILTGLRDQYSDDTFLSALNIINDAYMLHDDEAIRAELKLLFREHQFRKTFKPCTITIKSSN